jgi:hypothetical protein
LGDNQFKMMDDHMTFEIAISLVRDLAKQIPSRHMIPIFTRFFDAYKDPKETAILKKQVTRTLNIILIGKFKKEIHHKFKILLPKLITNHLLSEKQKIFENV